MKKIIYLVIILAVVFGGVYLWQKEIVKVEPEFSQEPSQPSDALVSDEEIIKSIILARMSDAQKITSPQDILKVVSKYEAQSSIEEMQSRLPDILLDEQGKRLFVDLYKLTIVDPKIIEFTSVTIDGAIALVKFNAGSQQGSVFFRKENNQWKITMLAVKP